MTTDNTWKGVSAPQSIKEFKHIMRVLNRYYNDVEGGSQTESAKFRTRLVDAEDSELRIAVKKHAENEFMVYAEIGHDEKSSVNDFWVHIDGINGERANHDESHAVHNIVCMTDLWKRNEDYKCFTKAEEIEL